MEAKKAFGCPDCKKAKNVNLQPTWLQRMLRALHPKGEDIFLILVYLFWVYQIIVAPSNWKQFGGWIVPLSLVFAFFSWLLTLFLFSLPSYFREVIIGWPITLFVENDELHTHLGHLKKVNALCTRHYGIWRCSSCTSGGYRVARDFNRMVTLRSSADRYFDEAMESQWRLKVHRDWVPFILSSSIALEGIPIQLVSSPQMYTLCEQIGKDVDAQHQAIAADAEGLGRSKHGQSMRQWLSNRLAAWRQIGKSIYWFSPEEHASVRSPFVSALTSVNDREDELAAKRRGRRRLTTSEQLAGLGPIEPTRV